MANRKISEAMMIAAPSSETVAAPTPLPSA